MQLRKGPINRRDAMDVAQQSRNRTARSVWSATSLLALSNDASRPKAPRSSNLELRTSKSRAKPPKATSRPVDSQPIATLKPLQSLPKATSMRPQCDPKAAPRLPQSYSGECALGGSTGRTGFSQGGDGPSIVFACLQQTERPCRRYASQLSCLRSADSPHDGRGLPHSPGTGGRNGFRRGPQARGPRDL